MMGPLVAFLAHLRIRDLVRSRESNSLLPGGSARIALPVLNFDFPTRERLCHSLVRQQHQESGAMRLVWLHQDSSPMRLNDCAADRQTHTQSTFFRGEERLENPFPLARLNSDPTITYL
jgi:hypothetical protein